MFSVNNFYDYLRHTYDWPKKCYTIRSFANHGDCNLYDLNEAVRPLVPNRYYGFCELYDQEPIYINRISTAGLDNIPGYLKEYKLLSRNDYIFRHSSGVHCPIICHSEKNSSELKLFVENHFADVYYWYHGMISRDWFRHWKHYKKIHNNHSMRFGVYARDGSDDRSYRINLLKTLPTSQTYVRLQKLIAEQAPELKDIWPAAEKEYNSEASATISWDDHNQFDIHIVAETVYDSTNKIHLTEKIFKPMVMFQPFILFANAGSLDYIRNYGFETFGSLWNESYDTETDSLIRFNKTTDTIKWISSLSEKEYKHLLEKAKPIVEHNRNHFYSDRFEQQLLSEMHENFNNAFAMQEEKFFTMPGGTWFYYFDQLYHHGVDIKTLKGTQLSNMVKYIDQHYPAIASKIIKKYNHLF